MFYAQRDQSAGEGVGYLTQFSIRKTFVLMKGDNGFVLREQRRDAVEILTDRLPDEGHVARTEGVTRVLHGGRFARPDPDYLEANRTQFPPASGAKAAGRYRFLRGSILCNARNS